MAHPHQPPENQSYDRAKLRANRDKIWAEALREYRKMVAEHGDHLPLYLTDPRVDAYARILQGLIKQEDGSSDEVNRIADYVIMSGDQEGTKIHVTVDGETIGVRSHYCRVILFVEALKHEYRDYNHNRSREFAKTVAGIPWLVKAYNMMFRDQIHGLGEVGTQQSYRVDVYHPLFRRMVSERLKARRDMVAEDDRTRG